MTRDDALFWVCIAGAAVDLILCALAPADFKLVFLFCAAYFAIGAIARYLRA